MNQKLQNFARNELKKDLAQCTKKQQHLFKQMYGFKNIDKDINYIVDNMQEEKLDWAMRQVERTLDKRKSLFK